MPGCLYRVTSPSGRTYIGVTGGPMPARWAQHVRDARRRAKTPLHRAIQKYGPDAFAVQVLVIASDLAYLRDLEVAAIAAFRTFKPRGYNATPGGNGVRALPADIEERRRASVTAAHRARMADPVRRAQAVARIQAAWTPDRRQVRAAEVAAAWAGEYGERQRARRAATKQPPPPKAPAGPRSTAGWTEEKRRAQAARVKAAAARRREALSQAQARVMESEEARLRIARSLSRFAGMSFEKARRPQRGGFQREVWDRVPETATFDELFMLGYTKGRLSKALRDGNLRVVSHGGP